MGEEVEAWVVVNGRHMMDASGIDKLEASPGHVVMMCGIAGSGKTTVAKALERRGFARLSIDEYIWRTFGRFGVDYHPEEYPRLQQAAEQANLQALKVLVGNRTPCVIDYSFWNRSDRLRYRNLIMDAGGHVTIVYLRADPSVLRGRLQSRNKMRHANAAFEMTEEILQSYIAGFEEPLDEPGLLVIDQQK